MTSSIDREALKQAVIAERGYWHPFHEGLLQMSPEFLRAYLDFVAAPWKSGHLEPKVREFVYIAIDGSVTHLYERGLRRHIENALSLGATQEEVLQVIELTCSMGHNTHELGMSVLLDEMKQASPAIGAEIARLTPPEQRLKDEYIAAVGHWPDCGDALLKFAPEFIGGFLRFRSVAWNAGPLAPKVKEFIGLAINAAPTSLHEAGVRGHIRRALQQGASPGEIGEVLQLASAIAIHTCTYAVPALAEAVAARAKTQP